MALSSPSALLFDMDGTLVDSVADLTVSANFVRAEHGLPPLSQAEIRGHIGDGARKLLERSFADAEGEVDVDTLLRRFREHYMVHCLDRTLPYPGVVETLERLAPLPMGIVSNKPDPMTRKIADGLGLSRHLGSVVGARPGIPVKPAPDLLELAAGELGVDPAKVWMVGDSLNDIRVARVVGAGAVAVGYGIGDPGLLAREDPDALLDSFADLSLLLASLRP